jgi:hypothetical protein
MFERPSCAGGEDAGARRRMTAAGEPRSVSQTRANQAMPILLTPLRRWQQPFFVIALLALGIRTPAMAPLKNLRATGHAPVNGARLH